MKKFSLCLLLLTLYNTFGFAAECVDCIEATSSANYAIMHNKKALSSDNFDHQKYYAERALSAYIKTKAAMEDCGCQEAKDAVTAAIDNLRNAVDPEDWDAGRFYSKKALADGEDMMTALDICTTGKKQAEAINTNSDTGINSQMSVIQTNRQNLIDQQNRIEAEKQKLLEEQKKLEAQLAQQQKLQEELKLQREKELSMQRSLKIKAEAAIENYKVSLSDIIDLLGCSDAKTFLNSSVTRSEQTLQNETLSDTRRYYLNQVLSIQQQALKKLEDCNQ